MTNFEKVKEFHEAFGLDIKSNPELAPKDKQQLRLDLIEEEYRELRDGLFNRDIVEVADALTDLLYVVYGMGLVYGIDLDQCFEEVHNSNMSKLDENGKPIYREDGKVLKGPNYREPDLKTLLGLKGA